MLRKYLAAIVVAGTLVVSACNTVSGAGKDLESASNATKDAINH